MLPIELWMEVLVFGGPLQLVTAESRRLPAIRRIQRFWRRVRMRGAPGNIVIATSRRQRGVQRMMRGKVQTIDADGIATIRLEVRKCTHTIFAALRGDAVWNISPVT